MIVCLPNTPILRGYSHKEWTSYWGAGQADEFALNESNPLGVFRKLHPYSLLLFLFAFIISLHYLSYYFTGISPTKHFVNPFLDGLALFLIYNFTLFAGFRVPFLTSVYIDKEKISYSCFSGAVFFERAATKMYLRNVSGEIYHCVLESQGQTKSLFVDGQSVVLLSLWGGNEGE